MPWDRGDHDSPDVIPMQVVELRGCLGAAWCARILSDLGATTVSVVPGRTIPVRKVATPPVKWDGAKAAHPHLDDGKSIVALDPIISSISTSVVI